MVVRRGSTVLTISILTSCHCPFIYKFLCFTSSIGMAKAALEAINGFNVYGMQVSNLPSSVISLAYSKCQT